MRRPEAGKVEIVILTNHGWHMPAVIPTNGDPP
jgi:hypothetical protein